MRNYFEKTMRSTVASIVMLGIYAAGLAVATLIEKYYGTPTAKAWVYYSPLFALLQFLMVVNFLAVARRLHLFHRKKWGFALTHLALMVILLGALVSHIFAIDGYVHIREGQSTRELIIQTERESYTRELPFEVELVKFTLKRYPGSTSPSSYESDLVIHVDGASRRAKVFMNNVLDVKGYRFFQSSYDPDERGTVLSVSKDVAGRTITYLGYAMLLAGLLGCLFGSHSRFATLRRQLRAVDNWRWALIPLALLSVGNLSAQPADENKVYEALQTHTVSLGHAEAFGRLPVLSPQGRIYPANSFASEILRKLHKDDHFGTLDADQFLLSLLALPEMWIRVPLIHQDNAEIASRYQLRKDYCAFLELFDSRTGAYRLGPDVAAAYQKSPRERTNFDKDLMKLDERANIFNQLVNRQMPRIFPLKDDPGQSWYAPGDDLSAFSGEDSLFVAQAFTWYLTEIRQALNSQDWRKADEILEMIRVYQEKRSSAGAIQPRKLEMEILYNKLGIFATCRVGYLAFGGCLLGLAVAALLVHRKRWIRGGMILLSGCLAAIFLYHMYGMGLRWYIGGYAPWSNSYETMVYVAWATVLGGFLFLRRSPITLALASLFGGVILFVSGLNWMDPEINPLVPVLKSPWLMFHVAVIVAAYGLFGVATLLGITNLCLMSATTPKSAPRLSHHVTELTLITEMALWIGLALMSVGTFLGAIWANVSWGRYWGWDPKETWALITMVVYAIVLHLRLVPRWHTNWSFNFLTVIAFSTVLMTFFGVNYFLSGMHSYGENDQIHWLFGYLCGILVFILLLGGIARSRANDGK